jgi:hypothetical protein
MEVFADDPCGNGASAELGAVSHLQNVVVEPGHAYAAGYHQSFQTDPRFAWRKAIARALSHRYRAERFATAPQRTLLDLAQFFSASRRCSEIPASTWVSPAAPASA